jgi:hypothetical protein
MHQKEPAMAPNLDFQPDFTTAARFFQARTGLERRRAFILLDFEMLDFEPSPTTVSLQCSLDQVRKLVHTCLAALASFGDEPASAFLKMLKNNPSAYELE